MNKDQIRGRANAMGGKIKAIAGKVMGDKKLEVKGNAQRSVGRALERWGDVKQDARDLSKKDE